MLATMNDSELALTDDIDSLKAHARDPRAQLAQQDTVDEAARVCPHRGTTLEAFGEEVPEQLDVVPARFRVLRHRRLKYRCPCCEGRLVTAPMPAQPIAKSQASPGLLAFVASAKYADGLQLYRLSKQFERLGVELPRQTLARWMVQSGDVVVPLINLLRERMLEGGYIHCDETTVQVLGEPGKAPESKSYMWMQVAGTGETLVALFDYDPTRSGEVPRRLLEGFQGHLQADAYGGYHRAVGELALIAVLCMAHARRHFVDALKAQRLNPNKLPPMPPGKARHLLTALAYFRHLYTIERRIRGRPPEDRYAVREAESASVLARFHQWATDTRPKVPPKTGLGKALA